MSDSERNIFDAEEFGIQIVNRESRRHLIEIYPEETGEHLRQARAALEATDANKLHLAAHSLKGVVGNYLGTRAFAAATKLDRYAKNEDLEGAIEALGICEMEVKLLGDALEEFLEKQC